MEIRKMQEGNTLTITLEGRLDTTTAPRLEAELKTGISKVTELVFDFAQLFEKVYVFEKSPLKKLRIYHKTPLKKLTT